MASAIGNKYPGRNGLGDGQSDRPSSFEEFGIRAEIISGLQAMNIMRPFNVQAKFLDHLLNNPSENLIGIAHPGAGKTTAYCLSILQQLDLSTETARNTPQVVVLVPTARVARQVANQLRAIGRFLHGLTVSTLSGTRDSDEGGCSVIIGEPTRVSLVSLMWGLSREGDEIRMFILDDIVECRFLPCRTIKRNSSRSFLCDTPLGRGYSNPRAECEDHPDPTWAEFTCN
ncbi:P-loop containing nucleoside triphosphate hydrolase protein [Aspergillus pseudodeflectus]|uniref:ATP-dependent RNA helicase n=1 Tax=Aspergillus pseudodeflectus TaxID=176178 RepID=A0ABR4JC90_9EURO